MSEEEIARSRRPETFRTSKASWPIRQCQRRERPSRFTLPPLDEAEGGCDGRFTAAVAEGELSYGEVETAARLVELFVRSFDRWIRAFEETAPR